MKTALALIAAVVLLSSCRSSSTSSGKSTGQTTTGVLITDISTKADIEALSASYVGLVGMFGSDNNRDAYVALDNGLVVNIPNFNVFAMGKIGDRNWTVHLKKFAWVYGKIYAYGKLQAWSPKTPWLEIERFESLNYVNVKGLFVYSNGHAYVRLKNDVELYLPEFEDYAAKNPGLGTGISLHDSEVALAGPIFYEPHKRDPLKRYWVSIGTLAKLPPGKTAQ